MIYALYAPSRYTPRKVRVFLDFVVSRLRLSAASPSPAPAD